MVQVLEQGNTVEFTLHCIMVQTIDSHDHEEWTPHSIHSNSLCSPSHTRLSPFNRAGRVNVYDSRLCKNRLPAFFCMQGVYSRGVEHQLACLVVQVLEQGDTMDVVLHVAAMLLLHLHLAHARSMEHPRLVQSLLAQGGNLGQDHRLRCVSAPSKCSCFMCPPVEQLRKTSPVYMKHVEAEI